MHGSIAPARRFCPPEFTISQLREVYEAVWRTQLDAANFQRKVLWSEGLVAPLEKWRRPTGRGGTPARLWVAEGGYGRLKRLVCGGGGSGVEERHIGVRFGGRLRPNRGTQPKGVGENCQDLIPWPTARSCRGLLAQRDLHWESFRFR